MQYYSKYGTLNIEVYAQSESSSCGKEENIYIYEERLSIPFEGCKLDVKWGVVIFTKVGCSS
jgi:hypothetical protein